jgi:hypothetical protein
LPPYEGDCKLTLHKKNSTDLLFKEKRTENFTFPISVHHNSIFANIEIRKPHTKYGVLYEEANNEHS